MWIGMVHLVVSIKLLSGSISEVVSKINHCSTKGKYISKSLVTCAHIKYTLYGLKCSVIYFGNFTISNSDCDITKQIVIDIDVCEAN